MPDLGFEISVRLVMDVLPLKVKLAGFAFDEVEIFKVVHHEGLNEIESVLLVDSVEAINANALPAIETEEVQLFSMQAAVYWHLLRSPVSQCHCCHSCSHCFNWVSKASA